MSDIRLADGPALLAPILDRPERNIGQEAALSQQAYAISTHGQHLGSEYKVLFLFTSIYDKPARVRIEAMSICPTDFPQRFAPIISSL